jgi:hypothetical protein
MGAIDKDRLQRRLERAIKRIPVSVTIGGVNYTGQRTQISTDRLYMDAGRLDQYRLSVLFSRSTFGSGSLPAVNSWVAISGRDYLVLAVTDDPAGAGYRIDLGEEYAVNV